METADREGTPRLWLAPVDRSSPPQQIPRCGGRATHLWSGRRNLLPPLRKGTPRRKGWKGAPGLFTAFARTEPECGRRSKQAILLLWTVSLDGRRISAWAPTSRQWTPLWSGFPLDGKPPVPIGWIAFGWVPEGVIIEPFFVKRTYIVPRAPGQVLPRIPAGGFRSDHEIASPPRARRIDAGPVSPGPSPDIYALSRPPPAECIPAQILIPFTSGPNS